MALEIIPVDHISTSLWGYFDRLTEKIKAYRLLFLSIDSLPETYSPGAIDF